MPHPPGARLSRADVLVLLVAGGSALATRSLEAPADYLFPVVVGHFLLFCNVFRVRTALELTWAAGFVAAVGWQLVQPTGFRWGAVLLWSGPLAAGVIAVEMLSGAYHGVGWRWINPTADQWCRPRGRGERVSETH